MGKAAKVQGFDLPPAAASAAAPATQEVLPKQAMRSMPPLNISLRGGPRYREARDLVQVDAPRAVRRLIALSEQDEDRRSATVATTTLLMWALGKPTDGPPQDAPLEALNVSALTDEELAQAHRIAAKLAGIAVDDEADDGKGGEIEVIAPGDTELGDDDA